MPIKVVVLSEADFQKWLTTAKTKFATARPADEDATQMAAAVAEPAKAGH
jgi:heme/copper-type cytochrome/quinol oxidase subunit 2